MIEALRDFWAEYARSPSAYRGNVWGHIRNQMWHGWGIGFFGALGLGALIGERPAVCLIVAVYVAVIEVPQWRRFRAEAWDCVEDTAHVVACALAATGSWEAGVVQLLFTASGALRRRTEH